MMFPFEEVIFSKCDQNDLFLADQELKDGCTLELKSPSLAKLFDFKRMGIAKHNPTSLCGNVLEAIDLESHFNRIHQTFSKCIEIKRNQFAYPQKDIPVIYVLDVEAVFGKEKNSVVEWVCKTP